MKHLPMTRPDVVCGYKTIAPQRGLPLAPGWGDALGETVWELGITTADTLLPKRRPLTDMSFPFQ